MDHFKTLASTLRPGAAFLFFTGAVATWIAFDTEPPSDDYRTLAGYLGFLAMAIGCCIQIMQANRVD